MIMKKMRQHTVSGKGESGLPAGSDNRGSAETED